MEGYCTKCQSAKEIIQPEEINVPPRGKMLKSKCPTCGGVIYYNERPTRLSEEVP